MTEFADFELVKEFPKFVRDSNGRETSLRVYRSRFMPSDTSKPLESYRYHFGFERAIVEPVAMLLETTCYWGERHWREDGDFWVWWTTVTGGRDESVPYPRLNRQVRWLLGLYNRCLNTCRGLARESN